MISHSCAYYPTHKINIIRAIQSRLSIILLSSFHEFNAQEHLLSYRLECKLYTSESVLCVFTFPFIAPLWNTLNIKSVKMVFFYIVMNQWLRVVHSCRIPTLLQSHTYHCIICTPYNIRISQCLSTIYTSRRNITVMIYKEL